MRLHKVRIIRYCNHNGESVPKGTKGAIRKVEASRKWYVQLRFNGRQKRFALSEDRRLAEKMARELVLNRHRLALGLTDAFAEHRHTPIADHINAFLADTESRGRSEKHVATMKRMLDAVANECRIATLGDLTTTKVDGFLMTMAKAGKSARTRNSYRQAIVGFCSWCVKKGRLERNPLESVSKAEGHRVRERRALSVEELRRLLETTATRNPERVLLYRLALYTGLRKSELAALRVRHLSLDAQLPSLYLEGSFTKNKREALLPLVPFLADLLREHCQGKAPDARLVRVSPKVNMRIRSDLEAAGIAFRDAAGRYADFHSLRKCTATLLTMAGVHPRIAQQILRHSTIDLTMGTYTDATLLPLAEAVAKMPVL